MESQGQNKKESKKTSTDEVGMTLVVEPLPVSFEAHKTLGQLYLQKNQEEKALKEFEDAAVLEPDDPEAYFEIGKILYQRGGIQEAKAYFNKYLYLGGKEEAVNRALKKEK